MVCFFQRHRVDFGEPVSKYTRLCSAQFQSHCLSHNPSIRLEGAKEGKRYLINGSVPMTETGLLSQQEVLSNKNKSKVKCSVISSLLQLFSVCL